MPRTAKVFMTNRSQAVRLPKEYQFSTAEVFIRKEGDDVILSPRPRDWRSYSRRPRWPLTRSWPTSRICPSRNARLMPRFMLDTDTCSYIMKRSHPLVLKRLQAVPVSDVCMSVVTKAELLYGVEVSPRRAQDAAALAAFLPYVEALDVRPTKRRLHYAEIRADLKKRGAMIGANDLFIAAHARALGLTLVTNNTAEFERVERPRHRELGTAPAPA